MSVERDPADPRVQMPECLGQMILPRTHDIGGLEVRRALPARERQMIGPFIFFDQMGPGEFLVGKGVDVRPHPHIGLATVTYLFDGKVQHRDSLGTDQEILPGEVNWMTAGSGIVHSERTPQALRTTGSKLFGIQSWVALPHEQEEVAPSFAHYAETSLPVMKDHGTWARLIAGEAWGERSPVGNATLFYADARLEPGSVLPLPDRHEERAVYILAGTVEAAGTRLDAGRMFVFHPRDHIVLTAGSDPVHLLLLGGSSMDGPRHMFWNFVSSSRDRIEQAKTDWKAGRFPLVPGDEQEFIPLPG
jgi:redox-sensitive bicupin YhaK (pirin superfamily)